MDRRDVFDRVYLEITKNISVLSRACRRQVGALLVKDNNILSYGYNGTPTGFDNHCEDEQCETLPHVLHAEANAIMKACKEGRSTNGATLYLTFSPCYQCCKLIVQAGIKRVVYLDEHSDTSGLLLLDLANIERQEFI